MADELDAIDLSNLNIDKVKELKNAAVERLKAAGDMPLMQPSHQEGTHTSHTSHTTYAKALVKPPNP